MRYSAATCDPNYFKDDGITLRQVRYDPPRRTELFIVMTMYNEDEELFTQSMHGVIKNVAHLCKRDRSKTWGKDGWKKVVVASLAKLSSASKRKIKRRSTLTVGSSMLSDPSSNPFSASSLTSVPCPSPRRYTAFGRRSTSIPMLAAPVARLMSVVAFVWDWISARVVPSWFSRIKGCWMNDVWD